MTSTTDYCVFEEGKVESPEHDYSMRGVRLGKARFRIRCNCGWRSQVWGRLSAAQREFKEHKEGAGK